MKTIIAGSRDAPIEATLAAIHDCPWASDITTVISGQARGPDSHGELWAKKQGLGVISKPADWAKHGKAAGPIRNEEMAQEAEALIAVWDGTSRGTADMIRKAEARGLRVFVFRYLDR